MDKREIPDQSSEVGFNSPIYEKDLDEEHPPSRCSNPAGWQKVSTFSMPPWRQVRPPVVGLALLAAVLLIVDISLGAHYNRLKNAHVPPEDTENVNSELNKLQETFKTTAEDTDVYKRRLRIETRRQTQTSWELEHHMKRSTDYEERLVTLAKDITTLKFVSPMIKSGCQRCPTGWILMNSKCYFFPIGKIYGYKTFVKSRNFCQAFGGDLAMIDSQDKENSTVTYLLHYLDPKSDSIGFWIGLKDDHEEGTWKWLDGIMLVEGYWNDGEPNDINDEDCAAVYNKENFFKAWNDVRCGATMKWICEKEPTSQS
ncbi:uncharacterized protein V6R79_020127 [Siganus canaliculatus]